ncbi:MAG: hypothetical protein WCE23_04615 [Candidatus Binatus sp.]|uniref:hypothetical protein n=1 Tax=Candidatus Binatus sp. TaxID=2811406 RepID=UPI003C7070B8
MNDVGSVALWVGLIAGIAGIVLSIVAIVAAVLADRRSSRISEHTIRSLQKIESTVGQQSDDTRQLIKAAWDKLLGAVDRPYADSASFSAKTIAQGIAAELREELQPVISKTGTELVSIKRDEENRVARVIDSLENSVEGALRHAQENIPSSRSLDALMETVTSLSPEAQALLFAMRRHHLSRNQYQKLRDSSHLSPPLSELRKQGLIIPVQHFYGDKALPCYYFPPGLARLYRAACAILPPPPEELLAGVEAELKATGYPDHDDDHSMGPASPRQ